VEIGFSPPLAHCTISYSDVQWSRRFTYLHMYSYQSLFVPVYAYSARRSCVAVVFTCLLPYDEKSAVFKAGTRFFDTFQASRCWIKIDSAVNLGETPSSEFVQCVRWVIRLMKTVESICCAVRHTVTLPRAVRRTKRSPHSVRVLIATTTDIGSHGPSTACPTMPAVRSRFYTMLQTFFPVVLFSFFARHCTEP